jgi:Rieske Fe-S protein
MKNKWTNSKFSRKEFMKISWIILLLPAFWLWYSLVKRQETIATLSEEYNLPSELPNGITFFDRIIAVKKAGNITFLSSRCTHLGCRIQSSENDELICPCHGSRFGMDGRNLMGPATKPLTRFSFRTVQGTGGFIIKLPVE